MKTKKTSLNELRTLIEQVVKEESRKTPYPLNSNSNHPQPQDVVDSLSKISDYVDLFNICYAIAPDSVAKGWDRNQLLDVINDVLLSRF